MNFKDWSNKLLYKKISVLIFEPEDAADKELMYPGLMPGLLFYEAWLFENNLFWPRLSGNKRYYFFDKKYVTMVGNIKIFYDLMPLDI